MAGGGWTALVTRAADIQLSLSTLMMAIIALALFRAGLGGESLSRFAVPLLVLVIGLAEWPYFARTASAATQVEAAKDYVRAGARARREQPRHHVAPHPAQYPVAADRGGDHASRRRHHGRGALSFLGLGMPVTKPSLGTLIRSGYDLMFAGAWWVTVIPGLVLIAFSSRVNVLGDALRDGLDPRAVGPLNSKNGAMARLSP